MQEQTARRRKQKRSTQVSRLNIGVIFFMVIAVYILINVFLYYKRDHISIYEVQRINLANEDRAEAVIIRPEELVTTDIAGYINYYMRSGTRVAKNQLVYSIDETDQLYNMITNSDLAYTLSDDDIREIKKIITSYSTNYQSSSYDSVYAVKDDLLSKINTISDTYLLDNLNKILETTGYGASLSVVKSPCSGVISYFSDSLDGLTADEVSASTFDKDTYKSESLFNMELKEKNSTIYKMITNENWSLVIHLSAEQYESLSEQKTLTFTILDNSLQLTKPAVFYQNDSDYFARVDMNQYMIQFLDQRYLSLSLEMKNSIGLKIPNSAIIEKEFYMIPKSYIKKGGDLSADSETEDSNCIIRVTHDINTGAIEKSSLPVELFHEDDTYYYIDTNVVTYGTYIYDPDTNEQFQISLVGKLEGVYNVNKGYTLFRRIERLYNGTEYSIVKMNVPLSISEHDHIATNASLLKESEQIH